MPARVELEHALVVVPASGAGQDRAVVIPYDGGLVVAVADGAGGSAGGARAAAWIVERVRRSPVRTSAGWAALLVALDRELALDPRAGETTAVVACVGDTAIAGASVGDSVAWAIGEGDLDELTRGQHRKPLLGSGAAIPVPFDADLDDATLLIATDGLHKYVPAGAIAATARNSPPASAARALTALARLPNGTLCDDLGFILLRRRSPVSPNRTT